MFMCISAISLGSVVVLSVPVCVRVTCVSKTDFILLVLASVHHKFQNMCKVFPNPSGLDSVYACNSAVKLGLQQFRRLIYKIMPIFKKA